ncbi:hypothetical protein [Leuconostoc falkenbergense]|uniref:hypothetical protein n=1 Tax=Leuconostoc falkenbergense TaxID=2766470 RepID=UPI0024A92B16|nr:hypothetical protein [Leuconostoc falkenbergense]MDI6552904.1 hypothetical protein [Leuconostoc falkenbergense]
MKNNIVIGISGVLVVIVCVLIGFHISQDKGLKAKVSSEKINAKRSAVSDKNTASVSTQPSSSVITPSGHTSESDKFQSFQSSAVNDPNTASYDPNKTAEGIEVTTSMINTARKRLLEAGLPADKWAPSDIKKIITESSQQNISIIDYAKANYHQ